MLRRWLNMKSYIDKTHRAEFFPALLGVFLQKVTVGNLQLPKCKPCTVYI